MTGTGPFLPGEGLLLAGLAAVAIASLAIIFWPGVRAYWATRGTHMVTCPLTGTPAAVRLDALDIVASAMVGRPLDLSIARCSRWPLLGHCRRGWRGCIGQIEKAVQPR